ncbi:hypothetical protein BDZ45DRAFT_678684 [Acephala macrosclerotiorum]|nr:hypothetical protein BDZ45DRAFT_678684 [Acephala macrosclerotiorum]
MDFTALVTRQGTTNAGALVRGSGSEAGNFDNHSGIYSVTKKGNAIAGAVKYGDNEVCWTNSATAGAFTSRQGTGAYLNDDHFSVASSSMIKNTPGQLLLGSDTSKALVGPDLTTMDLRTLHFNNGGRMAGIRNGSEAFAVVGNSRAYKNGDEVFVVSDGNGYAGVTGNRVWVSDGVYGNAWAQLCDCTRKNQGRWCYCDCHCGQSRRH